MDTGYLNRLWQHNVELISNDPVDRIMPEGVRTKSGKTILADAIVLATGFETQKPLHPMPIRGENGITIGDHVSDVTQSRADVSC